jgi:hypothetical protein
LFQTKKDQPELVFKKDKKKHQTRREARMQYWLIFGLKNKSKD